MLEYEADFHDAMLRIYCQAKKDGYNAMRFQQMILADGGLATAKKLLASKGYSEGLTRLWEMGRLDISMEALVIKSPWCSLFSEDELEIARKRLEGCNFKFE
ncbi:hypothetical protein PHA77_09085 [Edwardsiella tarda]|uniref:hypothetical protein n=1 Tax=Edwardsiella tarda TaxID=636 RepID=UPI002443C5D9|nr:hypothetical protein [Edwardsiella tarda]WGE27665.1 hypothetical protein PHA77_09085 [Edwardsiella tarda]